MCILATKTRATTEPAPLFGGVEFDDFKVTHTKTNAIHYNACLPKHLRRQEFYNYGLQTANSSFPLLVLRKGKRAEHQQT